MHETNHYHSLILDLQAAKRRGVVVDIRLLEHDIVAVMRWSTSLSDIREIAEHLEDKYRIKVDVFADSKKIIIYDAYCLDPKV